MNHNQKCFDQQDWRQHTCSECGWEWNRDCRRTVWGSFPQFTMADGQWSDQTFVCVVQSTDPACPAFVPREKPNDPRY